VRAGLLHREPAEAVGQRLGCAADPLLGPRGLGQRTGGVQRHHLAVDVDLACPLPVPADRGVAEAGVAGCHHVRVVVQDPPDDLLGDVPVDQLGAEGVPEAVRHNPNRLALFIPDVAAFEPAVQRLAVAAAPGGPVPVGVVPRHREQHRSAVRPPGVQAEAVGDDGTLELLVDRDQRFTIHLVVEVTQVGRAVGVGDDAVAGKAQGVGDPQPAAHQDQRDQPVVGVVPPREVVRMLELGHHAVAQGPR